MKIFFLPPVDVTSSFLERAAIFYDESRQHFDYVDTSKD